MSEHVEKIGDVPLILPDGSTFEAELSYVNIEPDWPNTLRYFLTVLSQHGFERFAREPIVSIIEMIRYLQVKDPDMLERIRIEFGGKP